MLLHTANAASQSKWLQVLINKGVTPDTNITVIPRSVFDAVTTTTTIVKGRGSVSSYYDVPISISGYGMGWSRQSIDGHEVRVYVD